MCQRRASARARAADAWACTPTHLHMGKLFARHIAKWSAAHTCEFLHQVGEAGGFTTAGTSGETYHGHLFPHPRRGVRPRGHEARAHRWRNPWCGRWVVCVGLCLNHGPVAAL